MKFIRHAGAIENSSLVTQLLHQPHMFQNYHISEQQRFINQPFKTERTFFSVVRK